MTEAQKEASRRYDKKNCRVFTLKLNYKTDAELIDLLENQLNIQGYLKFLLLEAVKEEKKNDESRI